MRMVGLEDPLGEARCKDFLIIGLESDSLR